MTWIEPIIYRTGFSIQKTDKVTKEIVAEPVHHGYYNINSMVNRVLERTQCDNYEGYLTGKDNFRFNIFPDYKSNRKGVARPVHYQELRDYMERKWQGTVIHGQEADDECSIRQMELNNLGFDPDIKNSIVCSIDKDFNNIPGWHYNYVTDEIYYVTETEALQNFFLQILTGDTSDGIPRIKKGWKKKKAETNIKAAKEESEMQEIVFDEVHEALHTSIELTEEIKSAILREITWRGQLVWMRRERNELWLPNVQI